MWSQVRTHKIRDGVHTIAGYGFPNYTFIEGNTGLILMDTGSNVGMGREVLSMLRKVSDKPIVAIIYSHHHYTGGTQPIVEEGGGKNVAIFGHPALDRNLQSTVGALGPMQFRRVATQLGLYLPDKGPDAAYAIPEPHFDDPALNASGHVPVNHPVKDGEKDAVP